ncbi:uncharacterized protein ACDP82_005984 [Pangshura tecta]
MAAPVPRGRRQPQNPAIGAPPPDYTSQYATRRLAPPQQPPGRAAAELPAQCTLGVVGPMPRGAARWNLGAASPGRVPSVAADVERHLHHRKGPVDTSGELDAQATKVNPEDEVWKRRRRARCSGRNLCCKCGLEGLSIHTGGVA